MKSIFSVLFFLLFYTSLVHAQVGTMFPSISGEQVSGNELNIPEDTKGKFTLIGLAYSAKAEDDLKEWLNPIYQKFIYVPKKPQIFDLTYDVNVYFIPMFTGAKQAAAGKAKKKLEKDIDSKLHPHVLIYKGKLNDYKDKLSLEDKKKPYFFLLDETGRIVYSTDGRYSVHKRESIEEFLDDL
ncbi:MAG: hypothetical protein LAT68_13670 [Cyclobacteriaceae bacterium]|nr:hypothetical protein [Cyclobacteriaceae bacterium]MCH8517368.1 hypothetical protein [Cyclobacteriaceae bacterium]